MHLHSHPDYQFSHPPTKLVRARKRADESHWEVLLCARRYHFAPILAEDKYDGAQMTLQPGFQMQIDLLRPFSRGSVGLRSADPHDDPVSLFNYFQDRRDMEQMVDAYRTGKETRLFEPFIYENDHFTKTGSGQT